ncbi:MAG: DNA mismatch repair endonuclease MutL [Candidatus Flexifilum sp.]
MSIRVLPEAVVAQIAAGEVVERPASVVKELVENALDAGSRYIHVAIEGDGRRRIQVADDGSGIRADEVDTAFARHATSKLFSADDLYNIRTLGFRGEALASIASVSIIEMTTRSEQDVSGTHVRLEAGQIVRRRQVGAPRGTVLSVESLFFNTPARLKFLKSEATEKRLIANVITRYAMAYPAVRFTLEQDGREIFRTNGTGNLLDVIGASMGLDHLKNMLEVEDVYETIRVSGYTSVPSFNRTDRSRITLFVNGRWVQDSSLAFAVTQAYHTLLMTGRYPIAVLMIDVPPHDVDVNVHPTKAEVRFRQSDLVFSAVQRAVRRAVIANAQFPAVRSSLGQGAGRGDAVWPAEAAAQYHLNLDLAAPGQHARHQVKRDDAVIDPDPAWTADPHAIPEGPEGPAAPRTLPVLRVVGQIAASYIVAEGPAGMYLIDQHAAHERVLYEQFMADHARSGVVSQYALAAQTVQVAPEEAQVLESHLPVLRDLGFEIEPFGPNVFIIRSVPALLADQDPVETIAAIVDDLEQGLTPGQRAVEERIILRVCKQAAVKAGQILSHEQMQSLIRQLERCRSPLTCPHGRPTLIQMTAEQLAREFGRTH